MPYDLTPLAPYSWSLSLKRLTDLPREVIARVEPGLVYVRAVDQSGKLGVVRVESETDDRLAVTITGDLDPDRTLAQVRRAFSVDLDLNAFHAHMHQADPVIASLIERYRGAKPICSFDLWEALCWTVIGQQINVSFAYNLKETLVKLCGRHYEGLPAFPSPEAVANIRYEDLTSQKYSRKKAEYVIDLAKAVAAGELDLPTIVALPFEEAVKELVKFRGVGRWTAEVLLMDAGAPDAFPAGDIGVRNAVRKFHGLDHQPTEEEVRRIGEPWSPFQSLTSYYLWLGLLDKEE